MNFYKILDNTEKFLHLDIVKVAEETSLLPDIPTHFALRGTSIVDATEALATLVALDVATPSTRNYHKVESIRQHIARMATNYSCEGKWKHIKDYLQNVRPFVIKDVIEYIMTTMSEQDYFGNFLYQVRQQIRKIKVVKTYNSVYLDSRPVKQVIRKRGYNDKGSLQPQHKLGRNQPRLAKEIVEIIAKEPKKFQWYNQRQKYSYDKSFDYHPIDSKEEKGSV